MKKRRERVRVVRFERAHIGEIVKLCEQEGWPTFPTDPARALRALTAPGVVAMVALDKEGVVGFAQLQTDGAVQAHLSLVAVSPQYGRNGIARQLIEAAFALSGADRIDLITETATEFYRSFRHRTMNGYRIYPVGKSN